MCFSKEMSFFNFAILSGYAAYIFNKNPESWRIYVPMMYLGLKDLLQGFLYVFDDKENYKYVLSVLSYVHICFQPMIINIFFSYFGTASNIVNIKGYWNIIIIGTFLFGLYELTNLDVFNIQNTPYCTDKKSDFCSDSNSSYIGKYHVGYKFRSKGYYNLMLILAMMLPVLLTNAWILSFIWGFFIIGIAILFNNVRDGEYGAIWCLLSIIPLIPVVYFRNEVSSVLKPAH